MDFEISFGRSQPSWIQIVSALGVPTAIGIAVWNWIWQSRLQKRQLKQAMFEKRYAVYQRVLEFLRLASNSQLTLPQIISFRQETDHAKFLFGRRVQGFLKDVVTKALRLHVVMEALKVHPGDMDRIHELNSLADWFVDAFQGIDGVFTPDLKLYDEAGPVSRAWKSVLGKLALMGQHVGRNRKV
jgi:hypothetical protein